MIPGGLSSGGRPHWGRVLLGVFALVLPASSQWRTGYFNPRFSGAQTTASIPWSEYTHVVHQALTPRFVDGICSLDTTSAQLSGGSVDGFVDAAHAAGVKALVGISDDRDPEAINACTEPQNISRFALAIGGFVERNNYDGVNLEWKHNIVPIQYADLISRLRRAMPGAILTVAIRLSDMYAAEQLHEQLEQINLTDYDWDSLDVTALTAVGPSLGSIPQTGGQDNAFGALSLAIRRSAIPTGKLGLSIPFRGVIAQGCLDSAGTMGVTDPSQIPISRLSRRFIPYKDLVNSKFWKSGTVAWDDTRQTQYVRFVGGSCSQDAFVTYPGPARLRAISDFIRSSGLGGVMSDGIPDEYLAAEAGDARYPLSGDLNSALLSAFSMPNVSAGDWTPSRRENATVAIRTTSLHPGQAGEAYTRELTAAGPKPISWGLTAGALPAGLSLSSSTGVLDGTPASAGTFTFTVTAMNTAGSDSREFGLTVNPAPAIPTITTAALAPAQAGAAYSETLEASGAEPILWSVTAGTLPAGVVLDSSTGLFSGTPAAVETSSAFTVTAANAAGRDSRQFSISVDLPPAPASLRQAAARTGLLMGSAASGKEWRSNPMTEPAYAATLGEQYNMLTPENALKWPIIHPAQNVYDFEAGDQLVSFAQAHDMAVRGHTLCWYSANPDWLVGIASTSRSALAQALRDHIMTVVGHYKGKIFAWDVVNEAVSDSASGDGTALRDTIWYDQPGIGLEGAGYIEQAFRWAHEADPNALLFYNDYGIEGAGNKFQAVYNMVKDFVSRGVPIDGVGFQMHIDTSGYPATDDLVRNIRKLTELGLQVHITEMDVRLPVNAQGTGSESDLQAEAKQYQRILSACLQNPGCTAFQTWEFSDKYSWIPYYYSGFGAALPFDSNYTPKPAFQAMIDALQAGWR